MNARIIKRRIEAKLLHLGNDSSAVALSGPRQAGKTILRLHIAETQPSIYLDLESEANRPKLSEPELYLAGHRDELVIVDEVPSSVRRVPDTSGLG
ncbi:MAG: AAA family ATPase [Agrobacterium tumefaciens]